jgi:hypothetical protein
MKRREFFKFLCGFLAGAGVVHAFGYLGWRTTSVPFLTQE